MTSSLGWGGIVRLGLVQTGLGACVVLATSTVNRVMVVELALPAILPGILVGLHFAIQALRPRWGYGSDKGRRLTPWIIGGMAMLAAGGIGAAVSVAVIRATLIPGLALAALSFVAIGIGVGASGTSLLVLMARRVEDSRRPVAATIVWVMMIFGFVVTAAAASHFLDPFSPPRLIAVAITINLLSLAVTVLSITGLEGKSAGPLARAEQSPQAGFRAALREVWAESDARNFAVFVFVSMVAYSAEELLLEPFAGHVFGLTPGQSAKIAGMQHGGVLVGMVLVAALATLLRGRGGSLRNWAIAGCVASAAAMACLAAAARIGPAWPLSPTAFALGVANGVFAVAAIGSMMRLVGRGARSREGTRMGLWGAAQGLAFGLGGILGAGLADIGRAIVSPAAAYGAIFGLEAVLFLVAAALALRIRESASTDLAAGPAAASSGPVYDVVVVGGGPAGATAADDLARAGRKVLLLDRAGRIKPCGGAIPPRLIQDFAIPPELLAARVKSARMIAPSKNHVDMPIGDGFVGMVDRERFDEFLRDRAARNGAERLTGVFHTLTRDADGMASLEVRNAGDPVPTTVRARMVIGADGANSAVARAAMPDAPHPPFVFAYHEIVRAPETRSEAFDPHRCDVIYQGSVSPDFYGWVFPHGETMSIGTGSAHKGFSLRDSVGRLRDAAGFAGLETIRREGAPIPMRPRRRWDNGRDVLLIGDAAGVVAPASGEGIYYAMLSGRLGAKAVDTALATSDPRALKVARKTFMRAHGRVFLVLGILQAIWYRSDKRREQFVSICKDPDVQKLTWDAYMNKELVRGRAMAHMRVFVNDMRHLLGVARA